MEPYNPNKSFIQFRLNPDAIKEELLGIIPGYRAVEYYRNNPDSSITNTLDLFAEDRIPFYAAHKYGANPGDYIKEAVLLAAPGSPRYKNGKIKPDYKATKELNDRIHKQYFGTDAYDAGRREAFDPFDIYNYIEDGVLKPEEVERAIVRSPSVGYIKSVSEDRRKFTNNNPKDWYEYEYEPYPGEPYSKEDITIKPLLRDESTAGGSNGFGKLSKPGETTYDVWKKFWDQYEQDMYKDTYQRYRDKMLNEDF